MIPRVKSGKVKSGKSIVSLNDKEKLILFQLKQNPEGLRAEAIRKLTDIPSRTIYRTLNKFVEKGLVLNQYPLWKPNNGQVDFWQTLSQDSNIFELHNLGYVVKLINKPDWWNARKSVLMRLKEWQFSSQNFGKNSSNPYQQIMNEDFVIQTYPESLIIIHRKRFFSDNPYSVIEEGIMKTIDILKFLEQRFRFNFFPSGIPCIQLRANDFNRMKDFLANKCKKEGTKFLVETSVGKCWVDYSEPFGKEANTPDIQETLERVTKDHIINKPMLNSELQLIVTQTANQISQVTQNQVMFNQNFESHVKAIQQLGNSVQELTNQVKLLQEENKKLRGNA
jgi:hypothetical protein